MKRAVALLALLALVLSGCAAAKVAEPVASDRTTMNYESPVMPDEAGMAESASMPASSGSAEVAPRRLVIQNANLSIVVAKPLDALDQIAALATEFKGFVVSSESHKLTLDQGQEVVEANITIRVDSTQLNTVLERIHALTSNPDEDVLSENVTGEDVTKEYVDLESQLRNLQATEAQLQKIMDQATKTEDVLSVYRELSSIRGQIETTTGQMKYYEEAAALSSISVYIRAEEAVQPLQVGGWKPVGTARNAVQALVDTLQFLGSAVIWIVIYILPVVVVIGLPIWLIVRAIRSAKRKAKAAKLAEATAEVRK